MADREVSYIIKAVDATRAGVAGAVSGLGKVARAGVAAGRKVMDAFRNIGSFVARQFRRALIGVTALGIVSVKLFADMEEAMNKFAVVFGDQADAMGQAMDELAARTGKSSDEMKALAADVGDMVKAMGLSTEGAANLSKELIALAIDTASFKNAQVPDVVLAFTSALSGERESLKRLGAYFSEAELAEAHYGNTTKKTTIELTQQQKILATMTLLTKKLSDAKDDAANTQDSLTNAFRNFTARLRDGAREIGGQIAAGLKLADTFVLMRDKLGGFIGRLKESKIVEEWAARGRVAIEGLLELFDRLTAGGEIGQEAFMELGDIVRNAFSKAGELATKFLEDRAPIIGEAIGKAAAAAIAGVGTKEEKSIGLEDENFLTKYFLSKTDAFQNRKKQLRGESVPLEDINTAGQSYATLSTGELLKRAATFQDIGSDRAVGTKGPIEVRVINAADMKDTIQ